MKIGAFEIQEPLPELSDPHVISMLHPWLDAGSVGTLVLSRLERYFGAKELGRLSRPGTYFDFSRYRPTTKTVDGQRTLIIPNSTIYLAQREDGPDLLFFHVLEPSSFAEDYIESVIELLKTLNVKRYGRIGGMYDAVPHTRPLLVNGTLAGEPLTGVPGITTSRRGRNYSYQGPTSIMNQVGTQLEKEGIETLSLMVRLPQYAQIEEDHAGSARLLEVLSAIYDLPPDLAGTRRGRRQYREITAEVERNATMQALVERLEEYYDSRMGSDEDVEDVEEEEVTLSPKVEEFLRDVTRRTDESS